MAFVNADQIYVVLDEAGTSYVQGSKSDTMKIFELVNLQRSNNWSVEELHHALPQFTMGQLYAALGYYWDHQAEIEADAARQSGAGAKLKEVQP